MLTFRPIVLGFGPALIGTALIGTVLTGAVVAFVLVDRLLLHPVSTRWQGVRTATSALALLAGVTVEALFFAGCFGVDWLVAGSGSGGLIRLALQGVWRRMT